VGRERRATPPAHPAPESAVSQSVPPPSALRFVGGRPCRRAAVLPRRVGARTGAGFCAELCEQFCMDFGANLRGELRGALVLCESGGMGCAGGSAQGGCAGGVERHRNVAVAVGRGLVEDERRAARVGEVRDRGHLSATWILMLRRSDAESLSCQNLFLSLRRRAPIISLRAASQTDFGIDTSGNFIVDFREAIPSSLSW
jgi:hypothetical protein